MTKLIPLSKGEHAIVDDDDYEWLTRWSWHYTGSGAAARSTSVNAVQCTILMHRAIMKAPQGMDVDHINRDRLDNRKSNLRLATREQNCRNAARKRGSLSQYKGVSWHSRNRKWIAAICIKGRKQYLGSFLHEADAARAYDEAARLHFGAFARTNFQEAIHEHV